MVAALALSLEWVEPAAGGYRYHTRERKGAAFGRGAMLFQRCCEQATRVVMPLGRG